MIVSISRRTDLPALYPDWLLNRLREGFVLVRQPYRPHRISRVELRPEKAECLVFWSKNPAPLLPRLEEIRRMGHRFYFQFTLNPYGPPLEAGLPPLADRLDTFRRLSETVGPERVVWRYDPVIFGAGWDAPRHGAAFEKLAAALEGFSSRCIFSFLDWYPGMQGRMKGLAVQPDGVQRRHIAAAFAASARAHGFSLSTCCEPEEDLRDLDIGRAACIDPGLIEALLGCPIRRRKDPGQRPGCGCVESVDIGAYGTCLNGCRYCYANRSEAAAADNHLRHDPHSPLLIGWPEPEDEIVEREYGSIRLAQTSLFSGE